MPIKDNISLINTKIEQAAYKSRRKPEDITFVCVTKTVDTERINEALRCGITDIGENRVQEMMGKYPLITPLVNGCNWHMIGHLQTNKVKYVVGKVKLIQSVDSVELAREIDKRSKLLNIVSNILIEVNIANEDTKFGVKPSHLLEFTKNISELPNIKLQGLMCVPPMVEDCEKNRRYFRNMLSLFLDFNTRNNDNICMSCLSMGMSSDYETAIEEGATMVRIGSSVFGARI